MKASKLRIGVLWLGAATVCPGAQNRLTIVVSDTVGLPQNVIALAVKLTRLTFADAGIHAAWLVCPSKSCAERPAAIPYLLIRVAPRMLAPPQGSGAEGEPAGYALTGGGMLDGARALVFYSVIEAFAANQRRRPSLVLACVLIHEIAHTLGLKHQTDGVMRATLNPHGIQDVALGLGFTPAEARQLRMGAMRLNDSPPSGEASLSPISATRLAPH